MSAGLAAQYAVVALIVLASVLMTFRKLAPQLTNRWLAGASIRLRLHGRSRFSKWLGRHLQPKQATGNCADGCATCGACGPKKPAAAQHGAAPLQLRPRSR
ncbi:MAG: DUF6587 family protein [Rhodanobacteraceae bacterium]